MARFISFSPPEYGLPDDGNKKQREREYPIVKVKEIIRSSRQQLRDQP
jgi:hypothetical protein